MKLETVLRMMAEKYGPIRIDYVSENKPDYWTVSISDHFSHEHSSSLYSAAIWLWNDLEEHGLMTIEEANRIGGVSNG